MLRGRAICASAKLIPAKRPLECRKSRPNLRLRRYATGHSQAKVQPVMIA